MLRKLLKHEFRATGRIMGPLYLVLLVLSLAANGSVRILASTNAQVLNILSGLVMVLFGICIVTVFVMTLVVMINRFRTNLLGDEGYVMLTLPASVHQQVWSKLIVSVVWTAASAAAVCLAAMIAAFRVRYVAQIVDLVRQMMAQLTRYYAVNGLAVVLEGLALMLLSCAVGCLMFYAAMAVGHSFANHKSLLSVAFFFLFFIVLQFLSLTSVFNFDGFPFNAFRFDGMAAVHAFFWVSIVATVLVGAVFYVITTQMLKRRLNLE
jgi:hypothetical protein